MESNSSTETTEYNQIDSITSNDQTNPVNPHDSNDQHTNHTVSSTVSSIAQSKMSAPRTAADLKTYFDKFDSFTGAKIDLGKDGKLNHGNFKVWIQEFGSVMRYYKLWTILKDDYDQNAMKSSSYSDMNETAGDMLYNNIGKFYQQLIDSEQSARGAYKKICEHFEGNPLVQSIRIMNEFADQVQQRSEDLEKTLIYFKNFKADLESLHNNLPDGLLIGMLVSIVPKANQDITKELMLPKNKDITLIDALNLFQNPVQLKREFEDRHPMKSICAITDQTAIKCLYCGYKNHTMSVCRKLEEDKRKGKITGDIIIQKKTFSKGLNQSYNKSNSNDKPASQQQSTQSQQNASTGTAQNSKKDNKQSTDFKQLKSRADSTRSISSTTFSLKLCV